MEALREIVNRKDLACIKIPESFGERVEIIVVPYVEVKTEQVFKDEEEAFLTESYYLSISEDSAEDKIWEKYL
jgi:hypothetical protein